MVAVNKDVVASPRALRASPSHSTSLTGPFLTADRGGRGAESELDGSHGGDAIPAGGYVLLFVTGSGPVNTQVPDSLGAPARPLSIIDARMQVTIGGRPATVTYEGVAPGFAGLEQLNVIGPTGPAPGNQPVFVIVNAAPRNAGLITVK